MFLTYNKKIFFFIKNIIYEFIIIYINHSCFTKNYLFFNLIVIKNYFYFLIRLELNLIYSI